MQSRIDQFRGRAKKEALAQEADKPSSDVQHLFKMILGLSQRLFNLERRLNIVFPIAKIADWRSMALMKLMSEGTPVTEDAVCRRAEELELVNFDLENIEDDKKRGLVSDNEATADKDHFAIAHLKIYKDNRELEDQQVVRTKIQLGRNELFPELDDAIIGMKVGEQKRFKLDLLGQSDEAEVFLLGLRKTK